MFQISDKAAIITGASGGIGLEIAKAFSPLGAKLALVDVDEHAEASIRAELSKTEALVMIEDLLSQVATDRVVDRTREHLGRIDILENSAGVDVRKMGVYEREIKYRCLEPFF